MSQAQVAPDLVDGLLRRLDLFIVPFAPTLSEPEQQQHATQYVAGLLSGLERKTAEGIAYLHDQERQGLQKFIGSAPWNHQPLLTILAQQVGRELGEPGGVIVFDPSAFAKKGTKSVGVARQWCGRLGKVENCQVGVFLTGVTPGGVAGLDAQLFLTQEWIADRKRRKKTGVPHQIKFQTKPQIAAEMLRRTRAAGKVQFDWIVADSLYGDSGEFLDALEAMPQRYLLEVKKNTLVWTVDPATLPGATPGPKKRKKLGSYRYREVRSVQEIAADLPADAWRPLKLREGANGPLVFEFATLRVWAMRHNRPGPPVWLVIRRSLDAKEIWYYVSNADAETPWQTLAMVTGTRFRVEEYFEDGKTHLGMADYEARAWMSWHHHMALASLAHLFVTLTKRDIQRDVPDLTFDMAMRVLRSAFARPTLSEQEAIDLIDYYRKRNDVAHESHRKTWLAKHKQLTKKLLL